MKAAIFYGAKDIRVENVAEPAQLARLQQVQG
jgi:hypothetical protein